MRSRHDLLTTSRFSPPTSRPCCSSPRSVERRIGCCFCIGSGCSTACTPSLGWVLGSCRG